MICLSTYICSSTLVATFVFRSSFVNVPIYVHVQLDSRVCACFTRWCTDPGVTKPGFRYCFCLLARDILTWLVACCLCAGSCTCTVLVLPMSLSNPMFPKTRFAKTLVFESLVHVRMAEIRGSTRIRYYGL